MITLREPGRPSPRIPIAKYKRPLAATVRASGRTQFRVSSARPPSRWPPKPTSPRCSACLITGSKASRTGTSTGAWSAASLHSWVVSTIVDGGGKTTYACFACGYTCAGGELERSHRMGQRCPEQGIARDLLHALCAEALLTPAEADLGPARRPGRMGTVSCPARSGRRKSEGSGKAGKPAQRHSGERRRPKMQPRPMRSHNRSSAGALPVSGSGNEVIRRRTEPAHLRRNGRSRGRGRSRPERRFQVAGVAEPS